MPWDSSTSKKLIVEITHSSAIWYYKCIVTGVDGSTLTSDIVEIIHGWRDVDIADISTVESLTPEEILEITNTPMY